MNLWEVSYKVGYKGIQDTAIVEAPDSEWALEVFEHYFPKKVKYVFDVKEFIYNPTWMKPFDELEIHKDPYPELHEIDWDNITFVDVASALNKAFALVQTGVRSVV